MNEFERLVYEMRQVQRTFFKKRSAESLLLSKQLEKKVDEYLTKKSK